jgi:hypothetical protein
VLPHLFGEDWLNEYYDELRDGLASTRPGSAGGRGDGGVGDSGMVGESAASSSSAVSGQRPEQGLPEAKPDDYRFCYIGPRGTWTPLHRDVLRSYSWSCNLVGRKVWIMYPPQYDACLRNRQGDLPWDVTAAVDDREFPAFHGVRPLIVTQYPGETIFVPSGWLHQVINLDDCVSINHNWVNSCNILHSTLQMLEDHRMVVKSIPDCSTAEDFPAICERLLLAHAGMNLAGFHQLLRTIAGAEISAAAGVEDDAGSILGSILSASFRLVRLRQALCLLYAEHHVGWLVAAGHIQDVSLESVPSVSPDRTRHLDGGRGGAQCNGAEQTASTVDGGAEGKVSTGGTGGVLQRVREALMALHAKWIEHGGSEEDPPKCTWVGVS